MQRSITDAKTFSNEMVEWANAVNRDFKDVWNAIGGVSFDDPVDDTIYLNCYEYVTNYLDCTGS